jgi:phosphatidylglycerophosphatase A
MGAHTRARQPTARDLRDPVALLGLGFGTGLSPRAPGTLGSLVGVLLAVLLAPTGSTTELLATVAVVTGGVPICAHTARRLGQHDHAAIVWDEIAGMLLALVTLPASAIWGMAAFVLFRALDIAKPWPVSWIDRKVGGGLGIMADDVIAGLATALILHGARWLTGL